MASLHAHFVSWILKRRLKPRLALAANALAVRKLMRPEPLKVPAGVRITPQEIGGVPGEWVEASSSSKVTLLYLHGGGYVACSPEMHRPITVAFAQNGLRVFAPDYRMAPEHLFPAAVDDAVSVYRALLEQGAKIVVGGDSAGGGLALALMISLRDAGLPLPAAAALFSPWTDLAATGESLVTNDARCAMFTGAKIGPGARFYLGPADPWNPLASPLYADLSKLPPMLIHVGENEVLLDDSTRLAERARAAGVRVELKIWPVVPHVWQLVPAMPEARQSLGEASTFLNAA
jgi:monoterpene epsilon-lactone hydrolase